MHAKPLLRGPLRVCVSDTHLCMTGYGNMWHSEPSITVCLNWIVSIPLCVRKQGIN